MEKILYFDQEEMLKIDWYTMHFGHVDSDGTGFDAVHSDVSELWAICMYYLGNCS